MICKPLAGSSPLSLLPELEKAKRQFLAGDYEEAVFAAFRTVEEVVRARSGADQGDLGVPLMRTALNPNNGALTDLDAEMGEREAMSALFAGAIGAFKNPISHRTVNTLAQFAAGSPFGDIPHPVDWVALSAGERRTELSRLHRWVDELVAIWPVDRSVVPPCWYRHETLIPGAATSLGVGERLPLGPGPRGYAATVGANARNAASPDSEFEQLISSRLRNRSSSGARP